MSNSTVIPKEKLTAYQRWELHTFDQPAGQSPAPQSSAPAAAAAPTAAEAEAAKIRKVHQMAYEAGRADGLREGAARGSVEAQHFAAMLDGMRRHTLDSNVQLADELLGMALAIAQQMVRQSLGIHPQDVIPVVQEALARVLQPAAQATITLHPDDAALVREQLADTLAAGGWRVIEDATITRGGCRLNTLASELDATVERRWQRITTALGQDTPWLK